MKRKIVWIVHGGRISLFITRHKDIYEKYDLFATDGSNTVKLMLAESFLHAKITLENFAQQLQTFNAGGCVSAKRSDELLDLYGVSEKEEA